jgi:hypothetical protein
MAHSLDHVFSCLCQSTLCRVLNEEAIVNLRIVVLIFEITARLIALRCVAKANEDSKRTQNTYDTRIKLHNNSIFIIPLAQGATSSNGLTTTPRRHFDGKSLECRISLIK